MQPLASPPYTGRLAAALQRKQTKTNQSKLTEMKANINDLDWDFLTWIENGKADELWQLAQQFTSAERLALHRFLEAELAKANS